MNIVKDMMEVDCWCVLDDRGCHFVDSGGIFVIWESNAVRKSDRGKTTIYSRTRNG